MENESLDTIFLRIKEILTDHSQDLEVADAYIGFQGKTKKPAYHLYGSSEVSLSGKKGLRRHM